MSQFLISVFYSFTKNQNVPVTALWFDPRFYSILLYSRQIILIFRFGLNYDRRPLLKSILSHQAGYFTLSQTAFLGLILQVGRKLIGSSLYSMNFDLLKRGNSSKVSPSLMSSLRLLFKGVAVSSSMRFLILNSFYIPHDRRRLRSPAQKMA